VIDNIPVLSAEFILPYKARAWIDLNRLKHEGQLVDSKVIKKHRNDVFRLSVLLAPTQRVDVAESIKQDVAAFLNAMTIDEGLNLKDLGIRSGLNEVLNHLRNIYQLGA
jgi:hypothetical protein